MAMIAALCVVTPIAQAAYVTLDLQVDAGGTFDLYASTPLADSYGISFYNIDLENILTATHTSPMGVDSDAACTASPCDSGMTKRSVGMRSPAGVGSINLAVTPQPGVWMRTTIASLDPVRTSLILSFPCCMAS